MRDQSTSFKILSTICEESRKIQSVLENHGEGRTDVQTQLNSHIETYRKVAGDVAHDLNNLLLLISGYAELLMKNLDNRDQAIEIVQKIQTATLQVKELSQKLQAFTQVEDAGSDSEPVFNEESDESNYVRPSDVNIIVFVFDGELKQLVSRILEREGFGVGEVVVNKTDISTNRDSTESVDLIVADVDIFKVARERVRQLLRKYPNIPLLLLTNGGDEIPTIEAAGGSSSLSKDFRPTELIAEVNRIFAHGDSRIPDSRKHR